MNGHINIEKFVTIAFTMELIQDDDRRRRLCLLQEKIQDPRGIANIDSLLDTVQALHTDCDYPAMRKIKNIEM